VTTKSQTSKTSELAQPGVPIRANVHSFAAENKPRSPRKNKNEKMMKRNFGETLGTLGMVIKRPLAPWPAPNLEKRFIACLAVTVT